MKRELARVFRMSTLVLCAAAGAMSAQSAEPGAAVRERVGSPPEGKATVVFFRPSKFVGGAVVLTVREGEQELGRVRNGRYLVAVVEPGVHAYTVDPEAEAPLSLETEAGEIYFASGSISMGILEGRPSLSPASAADFEHVMAKLKPAKPPRRAKADGGDEKAAAKTEGQPAGTPQEKPAAEPDAAQPNAPGP